jgi:hypothetical protein
MRDTLETLSLGTKLTNLVDSPSENCTFVNLKVLMDYVFALIVSRIMLVDLKTDLDELETNKIQLSQVSIN